MVSGRNLRSPLYSYSDVARPTPQNYSILLSISPKNKHSFEAIHQSLFVVSLDHWPAPSVPADQRDEGLHLTLDINQHASDLPLSQSSRSLSTVPSDLLSHQYAIRSSPSALNRFFDKPLSLVVEPSTRAGAMGEHSPVDALVPSVVCEWAVAGANGVSINGGLANVPFGNIHQGGKLEGLEAGSGSRWTRLNFVSSPPIQVAIDNAKQHARTLVSNSDHQVSYFEEWGGEEMKRVCKSRCLRVHRSSSKVLTVPPIASAQPDAFVQLALQLAYFRMHRTPTPVYETALTRTFQHGRTETIRSFTMESYAFLRAFSGWKERSLRQTRNEVSTLNVVVRRRFHVTQIILDFLVSDHCPSRADLGLCYYTTHARCTTTALASSSLSPPVCSQGSFFTHSLGNDGPRDRPTSSWPPMHSR